MANEDLLTNPDPPELIDDLSSERRFKPNQSARRESISLPQSVPTQAKLEDYSDYTDNHINPYTQDINAIRGENQGSLEQLRNFGVQFVAGEVLGGALEATGYIADLFDKDNIIWGGQELFTNALSEAGTSLKEQMQEDFPIYEKKEGEVNMLDTGWWLKNGTSIAAMIPLIGTSAAASKAVQLGVKGLARGASLTNRGKKAVNALKGTEVAKGIEKSGGLVSQTLFSRHAESSMEAGETFGQIYDEYIERGYSEEQAKAFASMGASSVYKRNYWMLLQDLPQYALLRGLGKAKGASKAPASKGSTAKRILTDMASEGAEEAFQYVVGEEGSYVADLASGLVKPSEFSDRMGNYVNGEMFTSAFFGALGSGFVQGGAAAVGKYRRKQELDKGFDESDPTQPTDPDAPDSGSPQETRPSDTEETDHKDIRPADLAKEHIMGELYADALDNLDPSDPASNELKKNLVIGKAFKSIKEGKVESNREFLQAMAEATPEELEQLFPDQEHLQTDENFGTEILHAFDTAVNEFNKAERYGKFAESIARANTDRILSQERAERHMGVVEEVKNQIPDIDKLSKVGKSNLDAKMQLAGIKKATKIAESLSKQPSTKSFGENLLSDLKVAEKKVAKIVEKNAMKEQSEEELAEDRAITSNIKSFIEEAAPEYANYIVAKSHVQHSKKKADDFIKAFNTKKKSEAIPKEEMEELEKTGQIPQKRLDTIASKINKGEGLSKKEEEIYKKKFEDIERLADTKEKENTDQSGELAQPGDRVKMSITSDEVFDLIERDGELFLDVGEFLMPVDDAQREALIVQTTPEKKKREQAEKASKIEEEDSNYYEASKDSVQEAGTKDTRKNTIWSAAWKSSRNLQRKEQNDPASKEEQDISAYFEDRQPIEEGLSGIPRIDYNYISEKDFDINNLSDEQILNIPIAVDLVDSMGDMVVEGETPVTVHIHTEQFIPKIRGSEDPVTAREIRDTLLKRRAMILQAIAEDKEIRIPITAKGTGAIDFHHKRVANVYQLLESDDVELGVLTENLDYKAGETVPGGFAGKMGNPSQIGRVYAATVAANGEPFPLPLERAKLSKEEADLVFDLIKVLISNADENGKLQGAVKNTVQALESTQQILEMEPDITYMELFNFLVYESDRTLGADKDRRFRLDFENRTLTLSAKKNESHTFNYDEIDSNKSVITEILTQHYRNISKSRLSDPAYKDYLVNNEILYASVQEDNGVPQLFVNPVVYFAPPYVVREEKEEVTDKTVEPKKVEEDLSKEKDDIDDIIDNLEKDLGDDPVLQKKELAGTPSQKVIDIANDLSRRTGWNYELVDNKDFSWSGLVEGNKIFFNLAYANENTAYHEYAHPIIRQIKRESPRLYANLTSQMLQDSQARIVYNSIKSKNPQYSSDQLLEETIVQLIGDLASDNIKTNFLADILRKIWNAIKSFIVGTSTVNIADLPLDTKLSDIADLLKSNSALEISKNPIFAYQGEMGKQEFDAWVNTLLGSVMRVNNVVDIPDVENLDFSVLRQAVGKLASTAKTPDQKRRAVDVYRDIVNEDKTINEGSKYVEAIKSKLRLEGIIEKKGDPSIEDVEDETDVSRSRNVKPHYEVNGKDKVTADIKFMMSYIPKVNTNETADTSEKVKNSIYSRDYKLNDITNLPEYHTFADIWNTLVRELSGIVETINPDTQQYEDLFDIYMSKIEEIAVERPEFNILLERLMNKVEVDNSTKNRFVRSMYLTPQNYLTVQSGFTKTNVIEKNPQSPEEMVIARWTSNAVNNFLTVQEVEDKPVLKLDPDTVNNVVKKYDAFERQLKNWNREKEEDVFNSAMDLLQSLGIDLEVRELNYYLKKNGDTPRASLGHLRGQLFYYIKGKEQAGSLTDQLDKEFTDDTQWFTQTNKSIVDIAKVKSFFNADLSDNNVLGPDGKPAYNFSSHSMMSKRLAEWKNDPSYLEKLRTHPFYKSSLWADHIIKGKDLKVHNFNNIKTVFDKGNKLKNVSFGDRLSSYLNMTLSGYFPLHARGSNSTEFVISGFDVVKSYANLGNKRILSTEAMDILVGYIADEFGRIRSEQKFIEENPDNLIDQYHTENKNGVIPALQMNLFSHLQKGKDRVATLFDLNGLPAKLDRDTIQSNKDLREAIQKTIDKEVHTTRRILEAENLFDLESQDYNNAIDRDIVKTYRSNSPTNLVGKERTRFTIESLVQDYVVNGIIANKEQQKIFSGDPALYGDQDNFQKRIISSGSMGYSYYLKPGEAENYNSAVIQEVSVASKYNEEFEKLGIKGYGEGQIDKADAQAYVTEDFFLELLQGYGKWFPEYKDIADKIQAGDLTRRELIDLINKVNDSTFTGQPLKTVHSELHIPDGGTPRFIYDKQTILPLFSSLVEGTSLEDLLNAMNRDDVQHVSVKSGTKLGAVNPTKITDDRGNFLSTDNIQFNKFTQSKRFTFLQQDLPKKGFGSMLESSQAKHNIYVDLKDSETYGGRSKDDMINEINKTHSAISNIEKDKLLDKLTTDGVFDKNKGNTLIREEMTKRTLDDLLTEAIDAGYPPEAIVGQNIPIQNVVASIINNRTVKVKHTNGIAAIQVSSLGFVNRFSNLSEEQEKGITWLTDKEDLEPPRLVDGKFHPGSILLPHSILQKHPDILNDPEVAKEILEGIDFRIPNQAVSNIGSVTIAGILPAYMGDSAVVYDEITNKTGSDFDVDKIQIMMYNLHSNKPEKIKYWDVEPTSELLGMIYEDRKSYGRVDGNKKEFIDKYLNSSPHEFNSKKALENHKLDLYKDILSNEDGYKRMMSVLEGSDIEDAIYKTIEKIEAKNPKFKRDLREFLDPTNPVYQALTREIFIDANSAVGAVANHITDHAKSQNAEIYLMEKDEPFDLGIGNTTIIDGKPASVLSHKDDYNISRMLSLLMNAQVDAEKDPYVSFGNFNIHTISPVLTMTRLGIPMQFITDLVGSEMIREYVRVKRSFNNSFSFSDKTDIEQTIANFNRIYDTNHKVDDYYALKYTANPTTPLEQLKFYTKLEEISSNVSDSIRASKFTVNGMGKNIFDLVAINNSQAVEGLGNLHRKFVSEDGTPTMEQTYSENSVDLFLDTFGQQFIAGTPAFQSLVDQFADRQHINNTDSSVIEDIYRGLYSFIMSKAMNVNIPKLIGKKNSVAKELSKLKETEDNALLNLLQPVFRNTLDLISFPNSLQFSEDERNILYDAWKQLHRKHPEFSKRLAQYAYASSGFNYGINSFFQFMPVEVMEDFNIKETIEEAISEGKTPHVFDEAFEQIVRNNSTNQSIVPKVRRKETENISGKSFKLKSKKKRLEKKPEFIFLSERPRRGKPEVKKLYMLTDEKKGIYTETPTLGYDQKGHKVVEYDYNTFLPESKFVSGPVPQSNTSVPKETPQADATKETTETVSQEDSIINSLESIGADKETTIKHSAIVNYLEHTGESAILDKVLKADKSKNLTEFINKRPKMNVGELVVEIHKIFNNC